MDFGGGMFVALFEPLVEKVTKPDSPRVDLASFVVEAGEAGVKKV